MSPSQEKRLTNGKISSVPRFHREIKLEAALAVLGSLLVLAFAAVPAMAETPATICMPYSATTGQLDAGKPIIAGNEEGTCKNTRKITYHPLGLPGPSGLETLSKVLPHMNYEAEGVGGKPTIAFSGLNVQIDSGAGQENVINGEGNLVIGYNPPSTGGHTYQECVVYPAVSGSNNLILGEKNGADGYARSSLATATTPQGTPTQSSAALSTKPEARSPPSSLANSTTPVQPPSRSEGARAQPAKAVPCSTGMVTQRTARPPSSAAMSTQLPNGP